MYNLTVLGSLTNYPTGYTPSILQPVARSLGRDQLEDPSSAPVFGSDIWTAFEISWLDPEGRPHMAAADIHFAIDSPHIIESKSLKLYLFGLNQMTFADAEALRACVERDLSQASGAPVTLRFWQQPNDRMTHEPEGICVDQERWLAPSKPLAADLLSAGLEHVTETLYSQLLRSLCPVTAQPDWATLVVTYTGPRIARAGLLAYIASYREHQGFHEQCVEQIYAHLMARCRPTALTVYARYTRRGGLDINPLRTSAPVRGPSPMRRLWRQ
jgi:7-cyano-7-deazaguanine reductase